MNAIQPRGDIKAIGIVVLISGNGSNLQSIIDAVRGNDLPVAIHAVISNEANAYGLQRAQQAGIPTAVLSHRDFANRETYERELRQLIDQHQPQLVVLAGFMRILTDGFVRHYEGRMLNIHPSLLPKYRGLNTHKRAIEAADEKHGVTVHFVTHELDGGPLIIQAEVPVLPNDSADALAARVLEKEHKIYPLVIRWFAQGRLKLKNHYATLDGIQLHNPVQYRDGMENEPNE